MILNRQRFKIMLLKSSFVSDQFKSDFTEQKKWIWRAESSIQTTKNKTIQQSITLYSALRTKTKLYWSSTEHTQERNALRSSFNPNATDCHLSNKMFYWWFRNLTLLVAPYDLNSSQWECKLLHSTQQQSRLIWSKLLPFGWLSAAVG